MDKIEGYLEIGVNNDHEVCINLGAERSGHINFSPDQARHLAELLMVKADEAELMQRTTRRVN